MNKWHCHNIPLSPFLKLVPSSPALSGVPILTDEYLEFYDDILQKYILNKTGQIVANFEGIFYF